MHSARVLRRRCVAPNEGEAPAQAIAPPSGAKRHCNRSGTKRISHLFVRTTLPRPLVHLQADLQANVARSPADGFLWDTLGLARGRKLRPLLAELLPRSLLISHARLN